ncbi:toll/interleukin-1 receptor domain-containing protein [Mesorhizobium sp. M1182]|uniref:toll/interleukin-1 receptor domain-containing protein n=1 Tax=Mesorhizobium sp. M1182 TaxID=2957067 RepID=UPI0033396127
MVVQRDFNPVRRLFDRFFGYDVFISYSRRNSSAYASSLEQELRRIGLACFIDNGEIPPGAILNRSIHSAIGRSGALVPIIAKGTDQSTYVPDEIATAIEAGKQILPINVDDEIRETTWQAIQQYRWIDEKSLAVKNGCPSDGIAAEISRTFSALRRAQFRRLTVAGIGLVALAISALAYSGYRDARIQQAFGLFTKGLEARTRQDSHVAMLFFAKASTRNDSVEIRRAMTSVLQGPRWLWDVQIPVDPEDRSAAAPTIAFTNGTSPALLVAYGHRLTVIDRQTGTERRALKFPNELTSITVGDHAGTIALGDALGHVILFADELTAPTGSWFVEGAVTTLAFDGDESLIGVGVRNAGMRVLDPRTGELWFHSPADQQDATVNSIGFSHRSSRLFFNMGRYLYSAEPVKQSFGAAGQQNDVINAVAWAPSDDVVAVAGIDGPIQLKRMNAPANLPSYLMSTRKREKPEISEVAGQVAGVTSIRFVGDHGTLASASYDGTLDLWGTDAPGLLLSVPASRSAISDLAVSSDGAFMAAVGNDLHVRLWKTANDFGARLWDTHALADQTSFAAGSGGNDVASLAAVGGKLIIGHSSGSITLLDGYVARPLLSLQQVMPRPGYLKPAPGGEAFLAVTPVFESLRLQALQMEPLRLFLKSAGNWAEADIKTDLKVLDAAWTGSPDEIAVLTVDRRIHFGTAKGGGFKELRSLNVDAKGAPEYIAAATRNATLAVSFDDGDVAILRENVRTDVHVDGQIYKIALSPDGRFLTVITSGPEARMLVMAPAADIPAVDVHDWIRDVAYDPSSRYMLAASDPGGEITLYETGSWTEIARWTADRSGLAAAAFSSDGDRIYAAGNDGSLTSWPMQSISEAETGSPDDVLANAKMSTGLDVDATNQISLTTAKLPGPSGQQVKLDVPPPDPDVEAANSVLEAQGDQDRLADACRAIPAPDWHLATGDETTNFAIAGLCADAGGKRDVAKSAFDSFYEQISGSKQKRSKLTLLPGLRSGAQAYLAHAAEQQSIDDLDRALEVINAEYQASWRKDSFIRLPSAGLVESYKAALSLDLDRAQADRIAARADQFLNGVGADWVQGASLDEATAVPQLLFILAIGRQTLPDDTGAWKYMNRAAEAEGVLVGREAMSGNPDESDERQAWARLLLEAVAAACQVVKNSEQEGLSATAVKEIVDKATADNHSLLAQVQSSDGSPLLDRQMLQRIAALEEQLQVCPSLIPEQ